MEQTTHYQLNQWAGEDRIMRLDFNADNEKLDTALHQLSQTQTAHAAALETEQQTRSAQDTAIRQEFAAADTAERQTAAAETAAVQQSLNTQATAIRQEFAAADAAVAGQISLVKLAHIVTQQDAAQVDVDIGSYGLTNYMELLLFVRLYAPSTTRLYVRLNSISTESYFDRLSRSATIYLMDLAQSSGPWLETLRVSVLENAVQCSGGYSSTMASISTTEVPLSGPIMLNFVPYHTGAMIQAGGEITIYGVRK